MKKTFLVIALFTVFFAQNSWTKQTKLEKKQELACIKQCKANKTVNANKCELYCKEGYALCIAPTDVDNSPADCALACKQDPKCIYNLFKANPDTADLKKCIENKQCCPQVSLKSKK